MGLEVQRRHMAWRHLPIRDVDIPDARFEKRWRCTGAELRNRLRQGFNILIHCKGGIGRAGTIAAKLLVEMGMLPTDAIVAVRAVRPGAIETRAQEKYVETQRPVGCTIPDKRAEAIWDRGVGALVGLAIGDAIGTTLEFAPRDSYPPLAEMVGGGPFALEPGQWTDDTAMALALADSLLHAGTIDEGDLMRRFTDWRDNGVYSCTGDCFDIGLTTSAALERWRRTGNPVAGSTAPSAAGNGSLMRLAPVALRYWNNRTKLVETAERQSAATHAAPAAVSACSIFAQMLADAIEGSPLSSIFDAAVTRADRLSDPAISKVAMGSWRGRHRREIRGSGYVVESLEAALWSVARSGSFAEAVLTAANLGEDADTTAAIAGQLAGSIYGLSGIPDAWTRKLAWRDRIFAAGHSLMAAASAESS
jgi:ADP-ribosyl-[dinitrogen reductase] hydrolase